MLSIPSHSDGDALQNLGHGASSNVWHLCWQSAFGRTFFPVPSLYDRIRSRLTQAHRCRGGVLLGHSLLPTEIHTVSQIPDGVSPLDVARAVGNVVARWVRGDQPLPGSVFARPYRAYCLSSEDELRNAIRMLAWRPVALGLCAAPSDYAYSAFNNVWGMATTKGFNGQPLLHVCGDTAPASSDTMASRAGPCPNGEEWHCWELTRGLALARSGLGLSALTATEVKSPGAAALIAAAGSEGVDSALRLLEEWVIVKLHSTNALDLHKNSDATAARGRALVGLLALQHKLCSAASVARYFGRAKATLSQQMASSRHRSIDRKIVETPMRRIIDDTTALTKNRISSNRVVLGHRT